MLEKVWEKYYPPHAPRDIDSLAQGFKPPHHWIKSLGRREDCLLIQGDTGACYTGSMLWEFVSRVGGWLQGLGAGKGSQVAVASENTIEALAFSLAVLASGSRLVLVDPLTVSEDLKLQVEGRNILLFAGSQGFLERSISTLAEAGVDKVLSLQTGLPTLKQPEGVELYTLSTPLSQGTLLEDPGVGPHDDSFSVYYSGIAGRTMQAIHTHLGLWLGSQVFYRTLGLGRSDSSLLATPFTHVLGFQASMVAPLLAGSRVVALAKWNPRLAARLAASGLFTYIAGVPIMFSQLASEGGARIYGKVRKALSAGAPLLPQVKTSFEQAAGAKLVQAYGMSESLILTLQTEAIASVEGTIGVPLPGVEAALIGGEMAGVHLDLGSTGELLVKAPWLMKGYEFEEENPKAFVNGWMRTGDIIHVSEDGLFYFRGVRKRIIKYKGYAILPRDLEHILESHPAVEKAVVVGEDAGELGQVPVARVWLRKGRTASPEELLHYVNTRVAFYKKLRRVEIQG